VHCSPVVKLEENALSPSNTKESGNGVAESVQGGQRVNGEKRVPLKLALKLVSGALCSPGKVCSCCFPSHPGPGPQG